jgi:hypothetical protein
MKVMLCTRVHAQLNQEGDFDENFALIKVAHAVHGKLQGTQFAKLGSRTFKRGTESLRRGTETLRRASLSETSGGVSETFANLQDPEMAAAKSGGPVVFGSRRCVSGIDMKAHAMLLSLVKSGEEEESHGMVSILAHLGLL